MKIYSNGKMVEVPGSGGGNPIGTIIGFLGKTAPNGYLICDGSTYNISDYPSLSEFFKDQFGSAGHFGGDGSTTFAIPDMRNLFLRGYHGEAEEQLSGDIGVRQDGTMVPNIYLGQPTAPNAIMVPVKNENIQANYVDNMDHGEMVDGITSHYYYTIPQKGELADSRAYKYSSRPMNMAVLYCIKATLV